MDFVPPPVPPSSSIAPPQRAELIELWVALSDPQRAELLRVARGMACIAEG
jgi:hypothetical protein